MKLKKGKEERPTDLVVNKNKQIVRDALEFVINGGKHGGDSAFNNS